jgi:hypothetical protein
MLNIIIFLIVILVFILCDTNIYNNKETYKNTKGKPVYMHNDSHKYLHDYIFNGWPFWYNAVTPLPFNNPTRFYGYPYYYTALHDYFYPRLRYY